MWPTQIKTIALRRWRQQHTEKCAGDNAILYFKRVQLLTAKSSSVADYFCYYNRNPSSLRIYSSRSYMLLVKIMCKWLIGGSNAYFYYGLYTSKNKTYGSKQLHNSCHCRWHATNSHNKGEDLCTNDTKPGVIVSSTLRKLTDDHVMHTNTECLRSCFIFLTNWDDFLTTLSLWFVQYKYWSHYPVIWYHAVYNIICKPLHYSKKSTPC